MDHLRDEVELSRSLELKKVSFGCVLVLFVTAAIELMSMSYLFFTRGLVPADYQSVYLNTEIGFLKNSPFNMKLRSNPYFGFLGDNKGRYKDQLNNYGFVSKYELPYRKFGDEVVVGVFGGSVAVDVGTYLEENQDEFGNIFDQSDLFKGKKLVFLNFAVGGHKQPQIFFVASYFHHLIDVALIIDGANAVGGNPYPQFPIEYPKLSVRFFADPLLDPVSKRQIDWYRNAVSESTSFGLEYKYLMISPSYFLFWSTFLEFAKSRVTKLSDSMMSKVEKGPSRFYPKMLSRDDYNESVINIWERYTRYTHSLLESNGVKVFSFVQPSQYVKGAKKFSEKEKKVAISAKRYEIGYVDRYNLLIDRSKELRNEGIKICDLSALFRSVKKPIYVDNFCHINKAGVIILAKAVTSIVGKTTSAGLLNCVGSFD